MGNKTGYQKKKKDWKEKVEKRAREKNRNRTLLNYIKFNRQKKMPLLLQNSFLAIPMLINRNQSKKGE